MMVPGCDRKLDRDEEFGIVYEGATHVANFFKGMDERGSIPLDDSVELFGRAFDVWLQCFWNSRGSDASEEL